jgi:hypothetical protein
VRLLQDRLQLSAAFRYKHLPSRLPTSRPSPHRPSRISLLTRPANAYTGDGSIAYLFRSTERNCAPTSATAIARPLSSNARQLLQPASFRRRRGDVLRLRRPAPQALNAPSLSTPDSIKLSRAAAHALRPPIFTRDCRKLLLSTSPASSCSPTRSGVSAATSTRAADSRAASS